MSFSVNFDGVDAGTLAALEELYRRRWQLEQIQAEKEQLRMARDLGERKAIDGIGAVTMQVHGSAYHAWGQQYGYEFWRDKGSVRHFLRRAPECRVKSAGTRFQVQGGRAGEVLPQMAQMGTDAGGKRFRKVYGEIGGGRTGRVTDVLAQRRGGAEGGTA